MSVSTSNHWTTWPVRDRHSDDGYLYVLEFSSGAVKVGHTTNPRARANSLRLDAAKYGLTITRWWVSKRHANHAANELALISEGCRIGTRLASEYFDCPFHDLVAFAAALPMDSDVVAPVRTTPGAARTAKRREVVRRLRDEGLSYRKIAAEVGISLGTVVADCRA